MPYTPPASTATANVLLGVTQLDNTSTTQSINATSTSFVDVDATNLKVDFTAPASGKVVVIMCGTGFSSNASTDLVWGLRDGSNVMVAGSEHLIGNNTTNQRFTTRTYVTGLTPGGSYSWKWCHRKDASATVTTAYGGPLLGINRYGPALMEVWQA